jgi:hypothetical protein
VRQSAEKIEFSFNPAEDFLGWCEKADVAQAPCLPASAIRHRHHDRRLSWREILTQIACNTAAEMSQERCVWYQDRSNDHDRKRRDPGWYLLSGDSIILLASLSCIPVAQKVRTLYGDSRGMS